MLAPNRGMLVDTRESPKTKKLLLPLAQEAFLSSGDIVFPDKDGRVWGWEHKLIGDLLGSIASGRLYNQLRELNESCDVAGLLIDGPTMTPNPAGWMRSGHTQYKWRYSSIQGILFGLRLKGVIVLEFPSTEALAIGITTIYKMLQQEPKFELHQPKLHTFHKDAPQQLKAICSLARNINVRRGEAILRHMPTIRTIANSSPEALMTIPDVGKVIAEEIFYNSTTPVDWDKYYAEED